MTAGAGAGTGAVEGAAGHAPLEAAPLALLSPGRDRMRVGAA